MGPRVLGLACLLIAALPGVAAAQEIRACAPNAPGVWCVKPSDGPWANLDFGLSEQIGDPHSIWFWKDFFGGGDPLSFTNGESVPPLVKGVVPPASTNVKGGDPRVREDRPTIG